MTILIKEMKELLSAAKELVNELGIGINIVKPNRNFSGDKIEKNGEIEIIQEVDGEADVSYDGEFIIIRFDDNEYRYYVGCIDVNSINAIRRLNTLTIKARRCENAEKTSGLISEKERNSETRS